MMSPTVLNTPTVLKISPTVLMISPTVLNTPHGTAHTLYRVVIWLLCVNQIFPVGISESSFVNKQNVTFVCQVEEGRLSIDCVKGKGGRDGKVRFRLFRQLRILLFIDGEPQKLERQRYVSLESSFYKLFENATFRHFRSIGKTFNILCRSGDIGSQS